MSSDRSLSNRLMQGMLDPLTAPIQRWLADHPLWQWLLTHPLWLLGVILFAIFLLSGLLGAIAHLTERVWLAVLRSPIWLTQWLFNTSVQLFRALLPVPQGSSLGLKANLAHPPNDEQARLAHILTRLEEIKQEQDNLWQEIKGIVQEKPDRS